MYYYIEPMVEADIEQVHLVERACFQTTWSSGTYRRELRQSSSNRYLVARVSPTQPPPRRQPVALLQRWSAWLQDLFGFFRAVAPPANPHPLVGYGGIWITVDEGHITTIAVDPSHRGQGVGELLLNGLVDQALQMGAAQLTLEVRITNTVAQQLYQKYGFNVAGVRKRYYTDNEEDALIMWTDSITAPGYQTRLRQLRQQLFARLRSQAAVSARHDPNNSRWPTNRSRAGV